MSPTPYRPIACADHERLEFAALTRQWLDLRIDGAARRVLPLDVYTRQGAEWARLRTEAGETLEVRLDRLAFDL